MTWFLTAFLLACLTMTSMAQAYLSLAGPTGTGALPSAEVLGRGNVDLAYNFIGSGADVKSSQRYLISISPRVEAGLNILSAPETPSSQFWHAKWQLSGDSGSMNHVALGWRHGGTTNAVYGKSTQVYLARTRTVPLFWPMGDVRSTIGVNWTELTVAGQRDTSVRPFISTEVNISHGLSVAFDYQLKDRDFERGPLYSLTLRQGILELGLTTMTATGVTGREKTFLFAGVNFPSRTPSWDFPGLPIPDDGDLDDDEDDVDEDEETVDEENAGMQEAAP